MWVTTWFLVSLASISLAQEEVHDVIVVGLGTAGLAALTSLADKGHKVLGLEAKSRIGGRVNTQQFGGGIVEFGAEWIHGEKGNPTYAIARENNVAILDSNFRPKCVNNGGYNETIISELYEYCYRQFQQPDLSEGNISIGTYVKKKFYEYVATKPSISNNKDFCQNFLNTVDLTLASLDGYDSWHDESLRSTMDYEESAGSQGWSWHKFGYTTLFDILMHKYNNGSALPLNIKLNSEVISIDWSHSEKVRVTTAEQTYVGKKVIVTVSLGVLKHGHKTLFTPSLPEDKQHAISVLSIGSVDKICLLYDTPWWGEDNYFFILWRDVDLEQLPAEDWWVSQISSYSVPMSNLNVLTFWITGAGARLMEKLDEQTVKEKVEGLLGIFFNDVPKAKDVRRTTWASDPHTRGSYSYHGFATDAMPNATAVLAAPLAGLHFAGEATHNSHFSTVHGALQTGWREADSIHMMLQNETPVQDISENQLQE